ncbi:hypothetical protein FALBO_16418 [Fusarium albosuccineum]|uniref:Ubiquitin-like protease family profile domain-containing protein n=1 Tax=Fusarium albosuccineum TaxID=1237068 RepID=A0A8H4P013_9HYPO|nr:hypothetical protein FALBO_16418 [Fusarium albosuccineum]
MSAQRANKNRASRASTDKLQRELIGQLNTLWNSSDWIPVMIRRGQSRPRDDPSKEVCQHLLAITHIAQQHDIYLPSLWEPEGLLMAGVEEHFKAHGARRMTGKLAKELSAKMGGWKQAELEQAKVLSTKVKATAAQQVPSLNGLAPLRRPPATPSDALHPTSEALSRQNPSSPAPPQTPQLQGAEKPVSVSRPHPVVNPALKTAQPWPSVPPSSTTSEAGTEQSPVRRQSKQKSPGPGQPSWSSRPEHQQASSKNPTPKRRHPSIQTGELKTRKKPRFVYETSGAGSQESPFLLVESGDDTAPKQPKITGQSVIEYLMDPGAWIQTDIMSVLCNAVSVKYSSSHIRLLESASIVKGLAEMPRQADHERAARKRDQLAKGDWFVFMCLFNAHWTLAVMRQSSAGEYRVEFHDSLPSQGCAPIVQDMVQRWIDRLETEAKLIFVKQDCPRQQDGSNCGPYAAECLRASLRGVHRNESSVSAKDLRLELLRMLAGLTPSECSALAHDVGVAVREVQAIRLSCAETDIGWPRLGTSDELEARAEQVSDNALGNTEKSLDNAVADPDEIAGADSDEIAGLPPIADADEMPPVSEAKVSSKHIDAMPTVEAAGTLTGSTATPTPSVNNTQTDGPVSSAILGPNTASNAPPENFEAAAETPKASADPVLDTSKDSTGTATVTAPGPTISTKERTVQEFDKAIANNLHEANALRARLQELDAKNARLSTMKDEFMAYLAETEAATRELEQLDKDDAGLQLEIQRLQRRIRDNAEKKSSAKQRQQSRDQQLSEIVRQAENEGLTDEGLFALLGTKGK